MSSEKKAIYMAEYRAKNPEKFKPTKEYRRSWHLQKTYGIDLDTYNQLFIDQNGCCKTCKTHQTELKQSLHIDHSHKTGKVRGLLCGPCNRAIGLLKENKETINNLLSYLGDGE